MAEEVIAFIFLFLSLSLGTIITFILSRCAPYLPYTVIMFAIGIIISLGSVKNSDIGESDSLWNSIDPHLILYIFLPALLFGEAMTLNFHQINNSFVSGLLLAGLVLFLERLC